MTRATLVASLFAAIAGPVAAEEPNRSGAEMVGGWSVSANVPNTEPEDPKTSTFSGGASQTGTAQVPSAGAVE